MCVLRASPSHLGWRSETAVPEEVHSLQLSLGRSVTMV